MKACLRCGADVPADDAFCGKCGSSMKRSASADATLRGITELEPVLEESAPPSKAPLSRQSSQRPRQATVLGLPPVEPRKSASGAAPASARRARTGNQTMLGFPRPGELGRHSPSQPPPSAGEPELVDEQQFVDGGQQLLDEPEPLPEASSRRQRAFAVGALLIAIAAGWLAYRFLSSHG